MGQIEFQYVTVRKKLSILAYVLKNYVTFSKFWEKIMEIEVEAKNKLEKGKQERWFYGPWSAFGPSV